MGLKKKGIGTKPLEAGRYLKNYSYSNLPN